MPCLRKVCGDPSIFAFCPMQPTASRPCPAALICYLISAPKQWSQLTRGLKSLRLWARHTFPLLPQVFCPATKRWLMHPWRTWWPWLLITLCKCSVSKRQVLSQSHYENGLSIFFKNSSVFCGPYWSHLEISWPRGLIGSGQMLCVFLPRIYFP